MEKETWKPILTLYTLLSTFEESRPKESSKKTAVDFNKYMEATNTVIKGLVDVIIEIANDYEQEKLVRSNLSKSADTLCSNQTASKAAIGLKDIKLDFQNSMRSFTIHNFENSDLPEPPTGLQFNTKAQIADTLKIPKDMQKDISFNKFAKKNSNTSTLIVRCPDINSKNEMEKIIRKSHKTSANLPKYIFSFVKKIRPLYVKLGDKLNNISCPDPYIMIRPTRAGDKLAVFSKDHTLNDASWNLVENLNIPYPAEIINSGHLTQTCKSRFLSDDEINICIPKSFHDAI